MKVLVIKMSSMGDVIHCFGALQDALSSNSGLEFHWVVESAFADLPALHPAVKKIIPIQLRKWREKPFSLQTWQELKVFMAMLRQTSYDLIIDAQGLLKSALVATCAKGPIAGFSSPRERQAAYFYQRRLPVSWQHHAIERLRALFAQALGYALPQAPLHYGLRPQATRQIQQDYLVFCHSTTGSTKHYPLSLWQQLAHIVGGQGHKIVLPWVNDAEKQRAQKVIDYCAQNHTLVKPELLPKMSLQDLAGVIAHAKGMIAVDTGLAHLASAFNIPLVTMFGATSAVKTGAVGLFSENIQSQYECAPCLKKQCHLSSQDFPCYTELEPLTIWKECQQLILKKEQSVL